MLKFGGDRAKALAYTALYAQELKTGETVRHGCGILNAKGFHGDARNGFYVYPMDAFMTQHRLRAYELRISTFASVDISAITTRWYMKDWATCMISAWATRWERKT